MSATTRRLTWLALAAAGAYTLTMATAWTFCRIAATADDEWAMGEL